VSPLTFDCLPPYALDLGTIEVDGVAAMRIAAHFAASTVERGELTIIPNAQHPSRSVRRHSASRAARRASHVKGATAAAHQAFNIAVGEVRAHRPISVTL
jgi:hypothetical protein